MRCYFGSFLSFLAIAVIFASPEMEAQVKSRGWKGPQKAMHVGQNSPLQMKGEETITSSGLRYWDIQAGTGQAAAKGRIVKIHYRGWTLDGKEFVNSVTEGRQRIVPGTSPGGTIRNLGSPEGAALRPIGRMDCAAPAVLLPIQFANPGLTAGPISLRPFGPPSDVSRQKPTMVLGIGIVIGIAIVMEWSHGVSSILDSDGDCDPEHHS
jgi:hypothetical protein